MLSIEPALGALGCSQLTGLPEKLFWQILEHLKEQSPGFARGKRRGPAFRFKMPIHVIDSTTLELVANCMDWAKHRRRKAAAKTHIRSRKCGGCADVLN